MEVHDAACTCPLRCSFTRRLSGLRFCRGTALCDPRGPSVTDSLSAGCATVLVVLVVADHADPAPPVGSASSDFAEALHVAIPGEPSFTNSLCDLRARAPFSSKGLTKYAQGLYLALGWRHCTTTNGATQKLWLRKAARNSHSQFKKCDVPPKPCAR